MLETLLLKAIELIIKLSTRKVGRNQKVIRILKALGLDKLKDDFDSIYARALVEYGVDGKSKILLQVFAEKEVITVFKEQFYNNDNEDEFKKLVKAFLRYGMAYKTINNLDEEINLFKNKFNEFTNRTRAPKELEMFNKILALELSNIERTFDYQADQYIKSKGDELHKELTEKIKYIDLIGEVRREKKSLRGLSEGEIKESKSERNIRAHKEEEFEKIKYDPIDTFITQWINNDNKNFLLLLGEYGTGKTTLCKHIICELIKNYLDSKETNNIYDEKYRIPILFNLRNFKQELIDDFVISQLNRFGIKETTFADFTKRMKNDEFILIFDGFDEMAQKIDIDEKRKNFYEIHKLIELTKNSKVLLTGRQEYFKSDDELKQVIDNIIETNSDLIYLLIFSDEQIKNYLETHADNPEEIWQEIKEIAGLEDLTSRAVLLEFIIRHLPELLEKKIKGETLKASDIYDTCINTEINRKIKEVQHLGKLIPSDKRLQLLQILSVWMFLNDTLSIDIRYIKKELNLKNYFKTELDWEIEKYLNEFLAFTFLIRIGNNLFQISHKSFRDYLVAREFVEEINKNKVVSFAQNKTSPEINNFIIEQEPNVQSLQNLLITSKGLTEGNKWQGTNAANLLKLVDLNSFSGLNLSGCSFIDVSFDECNFDNTKIYNSSFRDCTFTKSIFEAGINDSDFIESTLYLFNSGLKGVPKEIAELKNLQTLYLDSNQLKELPKEIAGLKNLQTLYLDSNQIKEETKERIKKLLPQCEINF